MIIAEPPRFEVYGAIKIFDVARVLALSGGRRSRLTTAFTAERGVLEDVAARTAIIVPIKDEDMLTLENILRAIPLDSLVILVSASRRSPFDAFKSEVELARLVASSLKRDILVVYQFDEGWREALSGTQLESMLGESGVREGKGEGMILGVLAAAALGADYVGFIDSDNYVPGAAWEYSMIYYTTFASRPRDRVMVRIVWPFKGKLASSDMYLRKRGRVSMHTNTVLNNALSRVRRIETEIVKTANSGEHAMSMEIALTLDWAGGFAVEPYQMVWLFEKCYMQADEASCPFLPDYVYVYQVEPRNPHIHAERGDEHIASMIAVSLGTIYHSRLAVNGVRETIEKVLREYNLNPPPPKPRIYTLRGVDPKSVIERFLSESRDSVYFQYS
ncbi:MAG: mannosyl-3-phosphoglycerate synthase [Desulfurococcales archaeon]|nr:mannosyl-3-phosphoglycerate synthase [Desulfurococcales archaeon]